MKDPFLSRRKRPNNHAKKLKLICSFNGTFQRRPPSGELCYTGGETRIVTADRNITLSRLKSKVSELLSNNALLSFSLRYRLTGEDDDDDAPLVLIASDDDVRCMTDEYEKLESLGETTRLWIFVCNNENMMNLNCGYGVSGKISHGFGGDCVNSVCDAVNGFESRNSKTHLCGGEIDRVKNCSTVGGVRCSDGSLRELVLKQQVLAKQSYGLDVEQINKEFTSDNQKHDQYDHSLEDHETLYLKFDGNPYREKDYEFRNTQLQRIEKLDPRDGNSFVGPNSFMQCLTNREKVTPWSTDFDLVKAPFRPHCCSNQTKLSHGGDRVWVGIRSGIRYHRNCLYHIRNHRNSIIEMGNHRNGRLEGRPWVGKFYPRLRSSSNISKQGQAIRSHYPNFWKPWSGYHDGTPEGIERMMNSGLSQTYLFDRGVPQPQPPNPTAYNCAYTSMSDQSLLASIVTKNPLISTRAMDAPEDLLTGSISEKHEVACQAPCKNLLRVPMSSQPSSNLKRESQLLEPMQAINTSGYPNSLDVKNRTKSGCNGKLSNIESSVRLLSNHRSSAHAIQGGLASSVDICLCNLSLSSSKEVEPPVHFSPACNGVSKALLKPQSKPLYLMDEEHSPGPQVEASNGVVSDSSSQNTITLEKDDEQEKERQEDHASRLSNDKKADIKESHKCSKANGSIPSDLAVFYSHLATRDLQTIKNSDLEYIKELGSGTYGTVFYGKWKGCDVAIKKLKRSCFTEGAPDQDRLVADFWKEAHILGQLHHPHIVAFYGVVRDGPVTNLATVTEYMVNGSLKQVLQRKDRTIDRRKRLIIAMDAAFGMEYLHEKNIVHFDLKSHNFLVNMRDPQRPVCKIGDLGLSKIKQRTLVSGGVRGTIPWMAPELLNSKENMVTEKVDVYSFGIVMWELLTGEEPYGNMRSEEIIAGIIIKGNLRPEIPSWCDPAWRSLMERCWSSDPECRPSFSEIAKELRAMSASMNIK